MPEARKNFRTSMQGASQLLPVVFVFQGGNVDDSHAYDVSRTIPRTKACAKRIAIQLALNFVAAYLLHAPPL